jgi:hypothetical protein
MAGKLNIFQRTMLQWNDTHPYNAVHAVRVPAALELERLRQVINRTVEGRGLTALTLNRDQGTYQYHGGPALCDLHLLVDEGGGKPALIAEIERQLNTAFVPGDHFKPFRFFVAPEAGGFWCGLTYFHAVADGESFVLLMKEIIETYLGGKSAVPALPANLYPPNYDNLLRHQPALLARKLFTAPALVNAMRTSCRPPYRNGQPTSNGFTLCSLGSGDVRRLKAAAKSWGVTLNDLFLGLLMKSLGLLASERTLAARRRRISVGCIVNTRKALGLEGRHLFGLFLGSFVVTHEVPEQILLRELAADVHCQTEGIKRHNLYVGAPVEMACARFMLSLLSAERGKKLYQKYYPLWGGITNLNLNLLWNQKSADRQIDYVRAVSTSPATPLVLSLTTVGNIMNLGFTYRSTAFLPAEVERVKGHFLDEAARVEACA